jgi:hypothetical protein
MNTHTTHTPDAILFAPLSVLKMEDGSAEIWTREDNTPGTRNNFVLASCDNAHDAYVLAAAPELLDALCAALPFVEDALNSEDFKPGYVAGRAQMIRAAIAKAKGGAA